MQLSPVPPHMHSAPLVIPQDRAVYRIKEGKFFGPDDYLYKEGDIIAFDLEPNQEMEPLNTKANENMLQYLAKLDSLGADAAAKAGRAWTSLADAFENAQALEKQEAKKVQLIGGKEMKPILKAKRKEATAVQQLNGDAPIPQTGTKGKLSIGGQPALSEKDILNANNTGL